MVCGDRPAFLLNASSADQIFGLDASDRIDLHLIDAISGTPAMDAFTFIGANAFGGQAGELRASQDTNTGIRTIEGGTNGDGIADLVIHVITAHNHLIVAADFVA